MKGFKCDKCGKWIEGVPANDGHEELLPPDAPLYSVGVKATVVLTKDDSREGQDLCADCTIKAIGEFIKAWKAN